MADDKKPAANAAPKPSDKPSTPETEAARGSHGEGIVQTEPKPEDYPPSAKITPPAEQVNTTLSQAIGSANDTELTSAISDATAEAADLQKEAIDKTDAAFAAKAKADKQG